MSFPQYQEYRDTYLRWLGHVPAHWDTVPLWSCFRRLKRVGHESEELLSVYRDFGVVPKASRDDNYNNPSDDLSSYQLVEPGDLVINKMKAWQGSVAISEHRGIVSPAYFTYEPLHQANSRYVHYLMRSAEYIAGYYSLSKGIRVNQWDLAPEQHSRMPVLMPPIAEQDAIARFLDQQTSKMDSLIAEQQRLVRLLKEKCRAVLSAVLDTGGVGRTVLLGRMVDLLPGYAFPSEGFSSDEGGVRLLRGVNVAVGACRWDDVVVWNEGIEDGHWRYALQPGDLVLGMDRPWIAEGTRVARVTEADVPSLLVQRVLRVRTKEDVSPLYIEYALSSGAFRAYLEADVTGVSVPHISERQVARFPVPAISLAEQTQRASDARAAVERIDLLVSDAESAVVLLRERRSALISAAVAGKIDVRNVVDAEAVAA